MPTTEEFIERWTQIVHVLGNLARASRNRRLGDIERILQEQEVHSLYEYIETNALYPDEELYATLGEELDQAAVKINYAVAERTAKGILSMLQVITEEKAVEKKPKKKAPAKKKEEPTHAEIVEAEIGEVYVHDEEESLPDFEGDTEAITQHEKPDEEIVEKVEEALEDGVLTEEEFAEIVEVLEEAVEAPDKEDEEDDESD